MVYTVTFNPAIDYVVRLQDFQPGITNRSDSEEVYFGGKGINVSTILHELGIETTALGFIAGFTGDAIESGLKQSGMQTDFIRLSNGLTRINVKIKTKRETEINAQGPKISAGDIDKLFQKLERLQSGDTLVLAGSVPNSLPGDIYETILQRLQGKGIRFVVDATKDLLVNVLKYKPFLIKPNIHELSEIFGQPLTTQQEIEKAAKDLQEKGAVNVLVSLGKDGALLVDEFSNVHQMEALGGKPVNTVGAGDSMVAGFIAGAEKGYDYALMLGSAAGGATACSPGLAKKDQILALLN